MNAPNDSVAFREQFQQLSRHRRLIAGCTLLGGLIALAVSFLLPRTYVAESALTISRSKIGENLITSDVLSTANFRPLMESRAVASQVIKDLKLDQPPHDVTTNAFFRDVIAIEEVRNSSVLLVRGRLGNPVLVAEAVNRVADIGAETARRVSQREAEQARDDIKLQLDEAKTRLDAAILRLDQRRTSAQLELTHRDVDAALEQRGELLELLINIEAEKARLTKAEQELASRQRVNTVVRSIDGDPALLEAARNGDGRPRDLLALQTKNQEINPVYQELDRQVAESRTHLAALQGQRAQMMARKLDTPQLAKLSEMYAKESELGRLEMERKLAQSVYEEVSKSYESARLLVAARSSGLQILTRAIAPDRPESRKVTRNVLIGVLSGLLISSFLVLVRGSLA